MGGDIKLESELGNGSKFSVSLPLPLAANIIHAPGSRLPSSDLEVNEEEQASLDFSGEGFRILLAEDNITTQNLISILIEQMGFELNIVDNGRLALEFLESNQVDLILMDCQMPAMDGFETTEKLRAKGLQTPIIALTAYARAEDEEECLASGMNDFLSKPFRQSEMRAILKKWLPLKSIAELKPAGNSSG